MTDGVAGETYTLRAAWQMNFVNTMTGTMALSVTWRNDAGDILGTAFFDDPTYDASVDSWIINSELTSVMPAGATFIRFEGSYAGDWTQFNCPLHYVSVHGVGGTLGQYQA